MGAREGGPIIAVTMGDPGGIGPEVVVRSLADPSVRALGRFRVYGGDAVLRRAARESGVEPFWTTEAADAPPRATAAGECVVIDHSTGRDRYEARDARDNGELSFRLVEEAIRAALRPAGDPERVDAIVTGPISKRAWELAGQGRFPGHTELLAARCRARRFGMFFESPVVRVMLVTTHVPLAHVSGALTIGRVFDAIELGAETCRALGVASPRVAVCGVNPHAGEGGLLGDEESRVIEPAIRAAREAGIDAHGPKPGDTVFASACRLPGGPEPRFDLVVAMYHDQGLIPVKLLARDDAVNITVGLPIVRTSPDHGTAFDIAGRGRASHGSMAAAIRAAARLARA